MDYSEENKNYLCKLIEKGLAENSMLATISVFTKLKPSCWPDRIRNGRCTSIPLT